MNDFLFKSFFAVIYFDDWFFWVSLWVVNRKFYLLIYKYLCSVGLALSFAYRSTWACIYALTCAEVSSKVALGAFCQRRFFVLESLGSTLVGF